MPNDRSLTSQEIDDGWCLDEKGPSQEDSESCAEYILDASGAPSSGFEEAYLEQVEGRRLTHRFGDGALTFGKPRVS